MPIKDKAQITKRAIHASETAEQQAVIFWWSVYCKTRGLDERLLVAIPNAQKFMSKARNVHAAYARAKAEGLRGGFPDLMLALPMVRDAWPKAGERMVFASLFIEMKKKGAPKPSPEQASYHLLLRKIGFNAVVSVGADEAIRAIKEYCERAT